MIDVTHRPHIHMRLRPLELRLQEEATRHVSDGQLGAGLIQKPGHRQISVRASSPPRRRRTSDRVRSRLRPRRGWGPRMRRRADRRLFGGGAVEVGPGITLRLTGQNANHDTATAGMGSPLVEEGRPASVRRRSRRSRPGNQFGGGRREGANQPPTAGRRPRRFASRPRRARSGPTVGRRPTTSLPIARDRRSRHSDQPWGEKDLNLRRHSRQIYSLLPLAARASPRRCETLVSRRNTTAGEALPCRRRE
jgi:hypothetical protein